MPEGGGRGSRELILAIGERLAQDLRQHGRPGLDGCGVRRLILSRKGVEPDSLDRLLEGQADVNGLGIEILRLQLDRLAGQTETEVALGVAPAHRLRHGALCSLSQIQTATGSPGNST